MISIIICSINNAHFEQVSKSISETIGVDYEIIRIENASTNYGICKAYNLGASSAKNPYLCFVHEDVLFRYDRWGPEIIGFFEQQQNVGAIGIAGSAYKSLVPSTWNQGLYNLDHFNLIQHYEDSVTLDKTADTDRFIEVKTLDGVFLFTKREIWTTNKFDEVVFDKFHCYDLDFCLQVGQKAKLFVFNETLIEHFSSGSLNKDWVHYSIKLTEKWKHALPVGALTKKRQEEVEWRNRKIFFLRMNILGYSFVEMLKVFFKWNLLRTSSPFKVIAFFFRITAQKLKLIEKQALY